jgi:glycosyltransferase involved in cell wall biosynthesis
MVQVSVIITTYNRGKTLGRAIDSVCNQTFKDWELIVVDDASRDNTKSLMENYLRDRRIKFFEHTTNRGQNPALNTGLEHVQGEYIAFLDSDDEWLPDMLEAQLNSFKNNPDIGGSYTWAGIAKNNGLVPGYRFSLEGDIYPQVLSQGYLSHMITIMVKKDCFKQIGNFDLNFKSGQDDEFCFRLAKQYKIALIKEIKAIIHEDGGNQVIKNPVVHANGWWDLICKFQNDIQTFCGESVLWKHYIRAAYLFKISGQKHKADIALRKAQEADKLKKFKTMLIKSLFVLPVGLFCFLHNIRNTFHISLRS